MGALLALSPAARAEPPTKDQLTCVDALNKAFAKLAQEEGKALCRCLEARAKGKLSGPIEDCFESTPSPALARALVKLDSDFEKRCTGQDRDGVLRIPAFGPREPGILSETARSKERGLVRDLLGDDLDAVLELKQGDTKPEAVCQLAVAKALKKCQDAKLKRFNRCKHAALAGKNGPASESASELARACLLDPNTGAIPDPKGEIAKTCLGKLGKTVQKKCAGLALAALFPGECAGATDLPTCLEALACGQVCVALALADNLDPDVCDALTAEDVVDAADRLAAAGGGTPTSPPPDFPDPNAPDPTYPDTYLEHDGERWPKPLDLDWQELPDPNSVVSLPVPQVTLVALNHESEAFTVDITVYADAGGPERRALQATLMADPGDPARLTIDPTALGLDLASMRFSGVIGAVAQVRSVTSGELIAVDVVHELFYHRPDGEPAGIMAYGSEALRRQFRAGDFRQIAEVDDLDGVVRISDAGAGLTSPGPVSYPNDDFGHLPGHAGDTPGEDSRGGSAP